MNSTTVFSGNSTAGIGQPIGITVFGTDTDSVVIVDSLNDRVVAIWNIGTINENLSVVPTDWSPGQTLQNPQSVYVDVRNGNNLYVADFNRNQVILYTNMQSVNPPPRIVAGYGHLHSPFGVQVDSRYNLYVVSKNDYRITFWLPNATNSIVVAGLGFSSSTSMGLNNPYGIALDERNSWLYVADGYNHRIQRYSLNGTRPLNGTTVAGGNGAGSGSHQLNMPMDIRLSQKTGALYILDHGNSRIQRWEQGATVGVTIAGDPNGNSGNSSNRLNFPNGLALNANETHMYVTDYFNNRVQRFQLI